MLRVWGGVLLVALALFASSLVNRTLGKSLPSDAAVTTTPKHILNHIKFVEDASGETEIAITDDSEVILYWVAAEGKLFLPDTTAHERVKRQLSAAFRNKHTVLESNLAIPTSGEMTRALEDYAKHGPIKKEYQKARRRRLPRKVTLILLRDEAELQQLEAEKAGKPGDPAAPTQNFYRVVTFTRNSNDELELSEEIGSAQIYLNQNKKGEINHLDSQLASEGIINNLPGSIFARTTPLSPPENADESDTDTDRDQSDDDTNDDVDVEMSNFEADVESEEKTKKLGNPGTNPGSSPGREPPCRRRSIGIRPPRKRQGDNRDSSARQGRTRTQGQKRSRSKSRSSGRNRNKKRPRSC